MIDSDVWWSSSSSFVAREAALVGRDPVIAEAKALLAERYGVSRGEAFEILRSISSRSNRKLRDVARGLVDEWSGSEA